VGKVSICVTTFNEEIFIHECIESVFKQSYENTEILVLDDGSSDRTVEICRQFDLTIFSHENRGIPFTRNRALELAQGEYIAFIDGDDRWEMDWLGSAVEELEQDLDLDLILGQTRLMNEDSLANKNYSVYFLLGACLIRKRVFDEIGIFDENLRIGEDSDWFLRCREANVVGKISKKVFLNYRRHLRNITSDLHSSRIQLLKLLRKSLNRRRELGRTPIHSLKIWDSLDLSIK